VRNEGTVMSPRSRTDFSGAPHQLHPQPVENLGVSILPSPTEPRYPELSPSFRVNILLRVVEVPHASAGPRFRNREGDADAWSQPQQARLLCLLGWGDDEVDPPWERI
jgi:hypothetical protein